jgi:ferric-dicitrate binding protein FerR (iron transport regulator)
MLNLHHAPATPAAGPAHTLAQAPPQRQRAVTKALLAGVFCLAGATHDAAAMLVSLDTSTLSGTSARLEFVLFDGDLTANNSLQP